MPNTPRLSWCLDTESKASSMAAPKLGLLCRKKRCFKLLGQTASRLIWNLWRKCLPWGPWLAVPCVLGATSSGKIHRLLDVIIIIHHNSWGSWRCRGDKIQECEGSDGSEVMPWEEIWGMLAAPCHGEGSVQDERRQPQAAPGEI